MEVFPLQDELIGDVIDFANAEFNSPSDLQPIFGERWVPDKGYSLTSIRDVQRELRAVLDRSSDDSFRPIGNELINTLSRIRLEGNLGLFVSFDEPHKNVHHRITWSWRIQKAPLASVCGLGIASIYQTGQNKRVRVCRFDQCDRYFIDARSRGKAREYCFSEQCTNQRNAARQKAHREKNKRARKKK